MDLDIARFALQKNPYPQTQSDQFMITKKRSAFVRNIYYWN